LSDIKIAAGYIRVSTAEQTELSPDSQIKLIREYARKNGYIVPDEFLFRDDGISGKSADKRPAFKLMIATSKQVPRPFDVIIVWKFSRFARNQEESLVYKNLLKRNGIAVISVTEPSNSDSPFSSLIESILAWSDEYFLTNLSTEVKRGLKEKSSRGEPTGRAPFGYKVIDKVLVATDDAPTVQHIFKQYVAGKSYRQIAAELNNAGIRQPSGKMFKNATIGYILKNPVYVGKIRWCEDGEQEYSAVDYFADLDSLPDGKHIPIISRDLWDAAQKRLTAKDVSVKFKREGKPVHMLKGLLRCSNCGGTLIAGSYKKYSNCVRLQCGNYNCGKCKVSHFISSERAKEATINALEEVVKSNTFVFAPKQPQEQTLKRDWDKLIAQEEQRLKRAKAAYLDGAYSLEDFKEVKTQTETNIANLRAAQEAEHQETPQKDIAPQVVEVLKIIKSPDIDDEAKNMALRSIIDKIVFDKHKDTFDIYFSQ
jgi:DNA invertase Pin-like site-specific DNA recombinase